MGGLGRGWGGRVGGIRADVNEELKFLGKFKKKSFFFWGGGSGGGGGGGGGGLGGRVRGGRVRGVRVDVNEERGLGQGGVWLGGSG